MKKIPHLHAFFFFLFISLVHRDNARFWPIKFTVKTKSLSKRRDSVTVKMSSLTYRSVVHAYVIGCGKLHGYRCLSDSWSSQQRHFVRFYRVIGFELIYERRAAKKKKTYYISWMLTSRCVVRIISWRHLSNMILLNPYYEL